MKQRTRLEKARDSNTLSGMYDDTLSAPKKPREGIPTFREDVDVSPEFGLSEEGAVTFQYLGYSGEKRPEFVTIIDNRDDSEDEPGEDGEKELLFSSLPDIQCENIDTFFEEEYSLDNCFNYAAMSQMELSNDPSIEVYAQRLGVTSARLARLIKGFAPYASGEPAVEPLSDEELALIASTA